MKYKTFKIFNLGCKVNQYDGAKLATILMSAGLKQAPQKVDLVIINSCAVTKSAIKKDNKIFNKAKKENPGAQIFVAGCLPRIYSSSFKKNNSNFIKTSNPESVAQQIFSFLDINLNNKKDIKTKKTAGIIKQNRSRYFLKIQDGCEQFCSYCIIPYTRGKLTSRPTDEIISELKEVINSGYKEIVLSGIHLGLYGVDLNTNLVSLLEKIIKLPKLGRIRLSSIEITEVGENLLKLMANNKDKICPHLHIPLQSGSDKILKLMNRPYSADYFAKKIISIRKYLPNCALTTDVIVGFPNENEEDFQKTINFIKKAKFSRLHVFPFSAHEMVPAAKMKPQITENIKKERAIQARQLGEELKKQFKKNFYNKILNVIPEKKIKNLYFGKSEYYFDVSFRKKDVVNKRFSTRINFKQIYKIFYQGKT